ncbi:hypothetical protein QYZ41_22760 [Vibrio parahaemolyticus]|nr:hypothetical protein [Vibrio parahaemolyticus]MDN4731984.1 hypothetical protein [Vibrio parahaemolyticus]
MHNWGNLSLFDTEDRYGAINSLIYYQTVNNNERIPSLSLAVFHRSHNSGNNTELRKNAVGIPDNLVSNGRYWLVVPNNLSELDKRTYSAWDASFQLENNFIDVEGKTVFVATTWDVNQDHFYIGSQSTDSFFSRVLNWSGLTKQAGHDGKLPGVYAHISAYLNLVDGHYFLHPSSNVADNHSMQIAYTLYTLICIVLLAVYWRIISSTLLESRHRQLFVFACALAIVGVLIYSSYLYASIVFSEYQLALSLTLPLLVAIFIILLITAKVLDRDKKMIMQTASKGFLTMLFLCLSFHTQAGNIKEMKALVVEVKGAVTALLPNQTTPIPIKTSTTIYEGTEVTLDAGGVLVWYKQIYGKVEREELYGPAVIAFPGKFVGDDMKVAGQRTLGGIVRGDEVFQGELECLSPDQIRLPQTDVSVPFLKFSCNQAPDYSQVSYILKQDTKQVRTGTFFEGFKNPGLNEGVYTIAFYHANQKIAQSSLQIDSFDLDKALTQLTQNQQSSVSTDLLVTMHLCQIGYKYLCETNLEYRYIAKPQKPMSVENRIVSIRLKALIRDSLNFDH